MFEKKNENITRLCFFTPYNKVGGSWGPMMHMIMGFFFRRKLEVFVKDYPIASMGFTYIYPHEWLMFIVFMYSNIPFVPWILWVCK